MGNNPICGMSLFQTLTITHGQFFVKIVTLQQAKLCVNSKVPTYKENFQVYYKQYEARRSLQIDEKADEVNKYIEGKKNEISKQYIQLIKINLQGQNSSLDELIKQLTSPIQVQKTKAQNELILKRELILQEINKQHERIISQLQIQKPLLKLYVDLEPNVKKQVDEKSLIHYQTQIAQENENISKQLEKSIGKARVEEWLKDFDPTVDLSREINNTKLLINDKISGLVELVQNVSNLRIGLRNELKIETKSPNGQNV